jgi:bifunctional non-homologous end joining protein LigD
VGTARKKQEIEIEGRRVGLTNLDKVLYPSGFTKGQVIEFYIRMAEWVLPHLKDRPITLKRYPDGINAAHFYEKDAPKYTPEWVRIFEVQRRNLDVFIRYIVIDDLPTLAWCSNTANLELHPFLHKAPHVDRPTAVAFDLDPGEGADLLSCAKVAFRLKEIFDAAGLASFAKVSGSKGMQIYVPLNTAVTYERTGPFALGLAQRLEREMPELVVSEMAKAKRTGKVFIDWSQNSDFKTTVSVYSLRAKRSEPYVSMPVTWEELKRARDAGALMFSPEAAFARLEKVGDLWAEVVTLRQKLPRTVEPTTPLRSRLGLRSRTAENEGTIEDGGTAEGKGTNRGKGTTGGEGARRDTGATRGRTTQRGERTKPAERKFIEPMRAALVGELPEGPNWLYEIKLDGYRALAVKARGGVELLSRNNLKLNGRFPKVAKALEGLPDRTILDGEIVALDERGRPVFNALQNYQRTARPIFYYVFDVLELDGESLLHEPLRARRARLDELKLADPVRVSHTLEASAAELVRAAREQGLEGIVAKKANSIYEPGARSGSWVKFKVNQGQELVIGGYLPGSQYFDSLLVGYYEGDRLIFNAKVRNGFVPQTRRTVAERLKPLETTVCPFANLPEPKNARRGEALTAEVMQKCRWVKPKLVAQIEYTDWTESNHLRHSRFAGLRDDKDPREVVRESAA